MSITSGTSSPGSSSSGSILLGGLVTAIIVAADGLLCANGTSLSLTTCLFIGLGGVCCGHISCANFTSAVG